LLAIAVAQAPSLLNVPAPSQASSLPHLWITPYKQVAKAANRRVATQLSCTT